uniref:Protein D7 n=1 Tax=Aceria tosichella TaxID=561515 RepID=A0A6G1S6Y8_9ACAR
MDDDHQATRRVIRYHEEQPDVYVTCPYFPEHVLRRSRMPYHLMKCQNNPAAPKLLACPFNYLHRVRPEDQQEHLLNCEDKVVKRYKDKSPSFSKTARPQNARAQLDKMTAVPPETGEKEWW